METSSGRSANPVVDVDEAIGAGDPIILTQPAVVAQSGTLFGDKALKSLLSLLIALNRSKFPSDDSCSRVVKSVTGNHFLPLC